MTPREKLVALIASFLGVPADQVKDDARVVEDLGGDSLDRLELVMSVEDEFDIEITDEEAEKLETVGEILALVEAKIAPREEVERPPVSRTSIPRSHRAEGKNFID